MQHLCPALAHLSGHWGGGFYLSVRCWASCFLFLGTGLNYTCVLLFFPRHLQLSAVRDQLQGWQEFWYDTIQHFLHVVLTAQQTSISSDRQNSFLLSKQLITVQKYFQCRTVKIVSMNVCFSLNVLGFCHFVLRFYSHILICSPHQVDSHLASHHLALTYFFYKYIWSPSGFLKIKSEFSVAFNVLCCLSYPLT